MRKRKHRSSKHQHHQSGNVKRQKQEQSQYWTAEKKRTVGVVEPRVVVRIPKKHLSEDSTVLVFFLIFVPFRCEGSVFKCERLAKIPDHILYIVLAKAASKEEEPKQFGVPEKEAVFYLIKGLL